MQYFKKPNEDGATAAEYALLVALIAVVIISSVAFFGTTVTELFKADWP